jgi:hypothetical protein
MTSLASAASDETRLWRAEHADLAYDQDIEESREAVREHIGLDYVAHVTYGILDFALGVPDRWPKNQPTARALESAARQLGLAIIQLDESCEPLDTGVLIRVVLHGENGALLQMMKVAGQSLFAIAFDGAAETVDRADARLAALTSAATSRIGGISLDWGGFRERETSGELWRSYQSTPDVASGPAVVTNNGVVLPRTVAEACRLALHPSTVHYIGIYRRDTPLWTTDIFDAPGLAPYFQRVSPDARRRGYVRVLRQVEEQSRRFSRLLALVGSQDLVRLVLDVARGGIYVLPLAGGDMLVAVTLIQSQVDAADRSVRELHEKIRGVWPSYGLSPAPGL